MQEFFDSLPEDDLPTVIRRLEEFNAEAAEGSGADHASDESQRIAKIINAKTALGQEIGPLSSISDPERRERGRLSLITFAETYFKPTFYIPWAPYQVSMLDAFQSVVLDGGRVCKAVRRGGLKSTCARVATIWAVLYGHRIFPVLVGASDSKANEHRENFFAMMASSPALVDDFPEILPLLLKWRQPKRQFRLDGRMLSVHPKDERGRIIFPDIEGADSCEAHVAPYSVNATDVSGLSFVNRNGVTIRPDLLIFDDVQTPQSALSPSMTQKREERITKTFCGLVGLGEKLAAIMVCTVREADDLTQRFLSRKKHPDWSGERYPSVIDMPDRMDLWQVYAVKLTQGKQPADGKEAAQLFYLQNRSEMDAGGKVAWEYDKLPDEISALQSLMTIRFTDSTYFSCEIQQEGTPVVNTSGVKLDAQTLLTRLSHIKRGIVPDSASYLTAFVDSSDQVLWWMVCAWTKEFSGWIVDYGTWPDQGRPVFYKNDLVTTISDLLPGAAWEEQFTLAHTQLEKRLTMPWLDESAGERNLDLIIKDWSDGGHKKRIAAQIQASVNKTRIRPSKGFAPKPNRKPVHDWGDNLRDRHTSSYWLERRSENPIHLLYDTNIWKTNAARRLLTTAAAPSSVLLPGSDERANRLLTEHLTAEQPKSIVYDGASGIAWEAIPNRNNDWFDCYVGCNVGASMLGCVLAGEKGETKRNRTFSIPGAR